MKNIAVIGAGLSGTLLVINLLKRDYNEPVIITWIDREEENHMGPAYSTNEDHLLNVPVEKMGAFPQDPEHFLKWLHSKSIEAVKGDYLPRKVYRQYIKEMLEKAKKEKKDNIFIKRIVSEVENIKVQDNCANIFISNDIITSEKVVLALGNCPPNHPSVKNKNFIKDKRYFQNPWKPDIFKELSETDDIFFIGTGQTMVDHAAHLYRKKHRGRMIAISRRGILPMTQAMLEPYPPFYDELKDQTRIEDILNIIRKHIKAGISKGIDSRAVIDSLRPYTPSIWQQLPVEEKSRFLRHAARYWEVIRSRIPPASEKIIKKLISTGQLKLITGRIIDLIPSENSIEVLYKELRGNERTLSANLIINCAGPHLNYEAVDQPLYKNLISGKLIHCEPLHLGIDALPDGSVIQDDETPSKIIYTIGAPLRGILWETVAVPEIRVQAEKLSYLISNSFL